MKLRNKFLIIFLSISILPMLFLSIYLYHRYTSLVEQQTSQVTENLLNITETHAERGLETLSQIVQTMYLPDENNLSIVEIAAQIPGINDKQNYDAAVFDANKQMKQMLQSYIYGNHRINGIYLFLPNGDVLGGGYGNGAEVRYEADETNQDWYLDTVALNGTMNIIGPSEKSFFLQSTPSETLSFGTALYSIYDRSMIGVLMIDCHPDYFDLSEVNPLPRLTELSIYMGDRRIYQTEQFLQTSRLLVYERELSLDSLFLHVEVDQEQLAKEFGITRITLIFSIVTAFLGVGILSWILSRSLTRPIARLSEYMLEPEETTDITSTPYFERNDEIGTLYTSYQKMLDERNIYIKNEFENKLILLDSQMRSLESQINAHFLYNTLESINSIATLENVPSISTMSYSLGQMFRYSIKTESELVPLSAELLHTQDYTTIQEIRFDHRFILEKQIPEELRSAPVLKLILQPLVENALYHGLNYCKSGDRILVYAAKEEENLRITVEDNGVGFSEEKLLRLRNSLAQKPEFTELGQRREESIGIRNIHTRLQLYYGPAYGIQIGEQPEKGSRISIVVPLERRIR